MDYFQELPDHLLVEILDLVVSNTNDIKALFRLRALSHRFNSLVNTKTKHLSLQVDKFDELFNTCLESSYSDYSFCGAQPRAASTQNLVFHRCFNHVTKVVIGFPAGAKTWIKSLPSCVAKCMYKATFGKKLKSCVILWYLNNGYHDHDDLRSCAKFAELKMNPMSVLLERIAYSLRLNLLPHLE